MKYLVEFALLGLLLYIVTFVLYLAVIKLRDMRDNGTLKQLDFFGFAAGYLILFVGYVADTILNWTVLTVVFFEIPQEFLSTARVIRHKFHSTGRRNRIALYFCRKWLTPVDPKHCEE